MLGTHDNSQRANAEQCWTLRHAVVRSGLERCSQSFSLAMLQMQDSLQAR
jgi:hypothetical protein